MGIGKNIEKLRKANKLSQIELAKLLHVSNRTISSWETDRTEPNIGMIEAMCQIFSCQKTDLIDGTSRQVFLEGIGATRQAYSHTIFDEDLHNLIMQIEQLPEGKRQEEIRLLSYLLQYENKCTKK